MKTNISRNLTNHGRSFFSQYYRNVYLLLRISEGCRIGKLVTLPDINTYRQSIFTVVNGSNVINAIDVFRKHIELRSRNVPTTSTILFNLFYDFPIKRHQFTIIVVTDIFSIEPM